jgi:hypothetical protein
MDAAGHVIAAVITNPGTACSGLSIVLTHDESGVADGGAGLAVLIPVVAGGKLTSVTISSSGNYLPQFSCSEQSYIYSGTTPATLSVTMDEQGVLDSVTRLTPGVNMRDCLVYQSGGRNARSGTTRGYGYSAAIIAHLGTETEYLEYYDPLTDETSAGWVDRSVSFTAGSNPVTASVATSSTPFYPKIIVDGYVISPPVITYTLTTDGKFTGLTLVSGGIVIGSNSYGYGNLTEGTFYRLGACVSSGSGYMPGAITSISTPSPSTVNVRPLPRYTSDNNVTGYKANVNSVGVVTSMTTTNSTVYGYKLGPEFARYDTRINGHQSEIIKNINDKFKDGVAIPHYGTETVYADGSQPLVASPTLMPLNYHPDIPQTFPTKGPYGDRGNRYYELPEGNETTTYLLLFIDSGIEE